MARLSIARSLRLALVCLTVALAVIAALGVASLYRARQRYENTLVGSSSLATAAANLQTAAVAEQEVLREVRGPGAGTARAQAAAAYRTAAAGARALAVIAALGVASLYRARQRYENTLVGSSSLATAAANLQTAAVAEQEVLREVRGPGAGTARAQAAAAYRTAAAGARALARVDPD